MVPVLKSTRTHTRLATGHQISHHGSSWKTNDNLNESGGGVNDRVTTGFDHKGVPPSRVKYPISFLSSHNWLKLSQVYDSSTLTSSALKTMYGFTSPHTAAASGPWIAQTPKIPQLGFNTDSPQQTTIFSGERGDPEACIFVANLNSSKTDQQLRWGIIQFFSAWGPILHAKVSRDMMGRTYSFVQFHTPEVAARAIADAQGKMFEDRPLRIEKAKVNRTLFIARLGNKLTQGSIEEAMLRSYLESFGPLQELTFMNNFIVASSRGCALARFRYRQDAIKAYTRTAMHPFQDFVVEWGVNCENLDDGNGASLYITNLPSDTLVSHLLDRFSKYGLIEHVELKNDKRFAFIRYSDPKAAAHCVAIENGAILSRYTIGVQFSNQSHGQASAPFRSTRVTAQRSASVEYPPLRVSNYVNIEPFPLPGPPPHSMRPLQPLSVPFSGTYPTVTSRPLDPHACQQTQFIGTTRNS
ncbi:RNA-binding domain-containing protein [Gonapodya prolifera JEL478]|uniref:RNA-binding domain-containing protein n=1 Tax=Gonapodya prolifera (strain JEL478) TaxID=1344416 RepID=A0A139ARH3_GONPJ|nr:RNA-binding domain-containing protein [Gonapodya prolifera JEL478]|eukprot:KXS19338.1 RNA-binding domain-containing protein [Gonapodya prolifera JEL478]